jgi:TonB-dependent starch-binding outer membrane protein SusC
MQVIKNSLIVLCTLITLSLFAQSKRTITGTISDASGVLIGAAVIERGTTNGVVTDLDGNYSLALTNDKAIITISFVGYKNQEIAVGNRSVINVTLESSDLMNEVVVVGYGTQKKAVTTGAITKVRASDLENMPVVRVEQSLLGRTSGVRVTTNSGAPGGGATVRIRGTTSINNSEPLYVVDGVPINGGIEFLNQSDIESIEVLKDAASAAIYGARSANGVIIVTTKKGKKDQMEISLNSYYGVQNAARKLSLLNAREYATLMNESSAAAGGNILFPNPDALGTGTDWQNAVFTKNAPIQNHELSLSAGSGRSQYFTSFGFFDQSGIVAAAQSNFQRFTTRFNSTHKINDYITVGNTLGYTRTYGRGVAENTEYGSPLSRAINLDPLTPLIETRPDV